MSQQMTHQRRPAPFKSILHRDNLDSDVQKRFLIIFFVGLPASGKSFTAQRIQRYLQWHGYASQIFNLGVYRRYYCEGNNLNVKQSDFFAPGNQTGRYLRDALAILALRHCYQYFTIGKGVVALFDATNTSLSRRTLLRETVNTWDIVPFLDIVWIENVCIDQSITIKNIHNVKLQSSDYTQSQSQEQSQEQSSIMATTAPTTITTGDIDAAAATAAATVMTAEQQQQQQVPASASTAAVSAHSTSTHDASHVDTSHTTLPAQAPAPAPSSLSPSLKTATKTQQIVQDFSTRIQHYSQVYVSLTKEEIDTSISLFRNGAIVSRPPHDMVPMRYIPTNTSLIHTIPEHIQYPSQQQPQQQQQQQTSSVFSPPSPSQPPPPPTVAQLVGELSPSINESFQTILPTIPTTSLSPSLLHLLSLLPYAAQLSIPPHRDIISQPKRLRPCPQYNEAFIRVHNAGSSVEQYRVRGYLSTKIYFFMLNTSIHSAPVYLVNSDEVTHILSQQWANHVQSIQQFGRCQARCDIVSCQVCHPLSIPSLQPHGDDSIPPEVHSNTKQQHSTNDHPHPLHSSTTAPETHGATSRHHKRTDIPPSRHDPAVSIQSLLQHSDWPIAKCYPHGPFPTHMTTTQCYFCHHTPQKTLLSETSSSVNTTAAAMSSTTRSTISPTPFLDTCPSSDTTNTTNNPTDTQTEQQNTILVDHNRVWKDYVHGTNQPHNTYILLHTRSLPQGWNDTGYVTDTGVHYCAAAVRFLLHECFFFDKPFDQITYDAMTAQHMARMKQYTPSITLSSIHPGHGISPLPETSLLSRQPSPQPHVPPIMTSTNSPDENRVDHGSSSVIQLPTMPAALSPSPAPITTTTTTTATALISSEQSNSSISSLQTDSFLPWNLPLAIWHAPTLAAQRVGQTVISSISETATLLIDLLTLQQQHLHNNPTHQPLTSEQLFQAFAAQGDQRITTLLTAPTTTTATATTTTMTKNQNETILFVIAQILDTIQYSIDIKLEKAQRLAYQSQLVNWRSLKPVAKGRLSGFTEDMLAITHPREYRQYCRDKLNYRFPEGESYKDAIDRTERLIIEISRTQCPILIVAPFSALRCIVGYFFGASQRTIPYIHLQRHAIFRNVALAYNNSYVALKVIDHIDITTDNTTICTLSGTESISSASASATATATTTAKTVTTTATDPAADSSISILSQMNQISPLLQQQQHISSQPITTTTTQTQTLVFPRPVPIYALPPPDPVPKTVIIRAKELTSSKSQNNHAIFASSSSAVVTSSSSSTTSSVISPVITANHGINVSTHQQQHSFIPKPSLPFDLSAAVVSSQTLQNSESRVLLPTTPSSPPVEQDSLTAIPPWLDHAINKLPVRTTCHCWDQYDLSNFEVFCGCYAGQYLGANATGRR